jgi:hypothetical protein
MDAVESRCAKVGVERRKEDGLKMAAAVAEDSYKAGRLWLWYGRGFLLFAFSAKRQLRDATAES